MPKGILGRKVGMSQVFRPDGTRVPVTVIKVGPCTVVRKKSAQGKDGYNAVVLGYQPVRSSEYEGETHYKATKPHLGQFKHLEQPLKILRELKVWDTDLDNFEVGATITADIFKPGEIVDVSGTSKGRGFAGVMKRHNFAGSATMTHGTHEYFRHGGSIGTNMTPGRVFRGKRMAGHYGNANVTVQNLRIEEVDTDAGVILVRGAIPGPDGGLVMVRDAIKRRRRPRQA